MHQNGTIYGEADIFTTDPIIQKKTEILEMQKRYYDKAMQMNRF